MRKQTKIAAVVSAVALLALGASMTSFAASKGTWMMEDGEWKCYDKNGDAYTNVFCSSNGKEYYVGDDGLLVRSDWVEYDGERYFVNSSGAKITNDWRLTAPYDDESADEEWYFFQSSGKMATNKKISYKGKTYYFDTDGKMLTGWITDDGTGSNSVNEANDFIDGQTYYCDETGARVANGWVYDTEPGVEDDDADADEYWYWLKASGKVATGKQANVKGQTFFFDREGRMLKGWVAYSDSEGYYQLYEEDEREEAISDYVDAMAGSTKTAVYFCGYDDEFGTGDGHAKKNKWIKFWKPEQVEAAEDDDLKWFWFDKNGKLYVTDVEATNATWSNALQYDFKDGVVLPKDGKKSADDVKKISRKKVNSKDYWFDQDGVMLSKFYLIAREDHNELYYFGGSDDGSMKTGSQSIKDDAGDTYKFYFYTKDTSYATDGGAAYKKGAGVTGNQNNKLYYFGMLLQADDYKYQMVRVEDPKNGAYRWFIVNSNGSIQHGNAEYKEDGDALLDTRTQYYDLNKNDKIDSDEKNDNNRAQEVVYRTAGQYKYSINKDDSILDGTLGGDVESLKGNSGLPDIQIDEYIDLKGIEALQPEA
jgi:glucan-binding YG repeat protein